MFSRTLRGLVIAGAACCAAAAAPATPARGSSGFDSFISPISNFTNFEDPRAITEVRPIFMFHDLANDFLGLDGGEAYLLAVQARFAVTERFALIATKDGYVWLRPHKEIPGAVTKNDGFANLAFGAKYAVLYDEAKRRIATLGLRYEVPSGDAGVLQGKVLRIAGVNERGDGVLNPFLSAGVGAGDFQFLGYAGGRVPINEVDSTFFDMSLHGNYRVGDFYPLVEVNWVHTVGNGKRLPLGGEGFDLLNLGSTNAAGKGVVTAAVGGRWRVLRAEVWNVDLGTAVEFPLTHRRDLFGFRLTSDVIVSLR